MGLYDNLRCKKPLPGGYGGLLQTKDFDDPYLEDYTIDDDGRLYREPCWSAGPGPNDGKDPAQRHDMNWHGYLDLIDDNLQRYRAKFTDGQLVEIVRV